MHTRIGDLYGTAVINQGPPVGGAKPPAKAAKGGKGPMGKGQEPIPVDSLGQEKMQTPEHEVSVDHPTNMHPPEEAQQQFDFLKQAMGGPQGGFVTKTPKSHQVAQKLARSGHIQHLGEKKLGNNHSVHVWQLTPKGVAAVGPTTGAGGRNRR